MGVSLLISTKETKQTGGREDGREGGNEWPLGHLFATPGGKRRKRVVAAPAPQETIAPRDSGDDPARIPIIVSNFNRNNRRQSSAS